MEKEKEEKKATKSLLIGLVCVLILILALLGGYIIISRVNAYKKEQQLMKDFHEYLGQEDLSIIYFMRTGCEFCELQEPILEEVASDYHLEYLTIDSSTLSGKNRTEVLDTLDIESRTPTLIVVKNGEVVMTQIGYLDGQKLVEFFIRVGILEEGSTYKSEENLTVLDYDKFQELRKSEELSAIIVGTSVCEYCKAARPSLSNIAKAYNVPIYYLNLNYLSEKNRKSVFDELKEMHYDEEGFVQDSAIVTPALLIVKNNRVKAHMEGLQSVTDYVKFLKEQSIIVES